MRAGCPVEMDNYHCSIATKDQYIIVVHSTANDFNIIPPEEMAFCKLSFQLELKSRYVSRMGQRPPWHPPYNVIDCLCQK